MSEISEVIQYLLANNRGLAPAAAFGKQKGIHKNMRFNGKKYKELMTDQNLTEEMVCERTGLYPKSFQWIMERGFASDEAMERLAEVTGVELGELLLPDISGTTENAIEFIKHSERATVTFSQPRYITRIKKLAEKHPEECEIVAINKIPNEGEIICAHVPATWVRIAPPIVMDLTEDQKEERRKRLQENVLHTINNRDKTDLKSI